VDSSLKKDADGSPTGISKENLDDFEPWEVIIPIAFIALAAYISMNLSSIIHINRNSWIVAEVLIGFAVVASTLPLLISLSDKYLRGRPHVYRLVGVTISAVLVASGCYGSLSSIVDRQRDGRIEEFAIATKSDLTPWLKVEPIVHSFVKGRPIDFWNPDPGIATAVANNMDLVTGRSRVAVPVFANDLKTFALSAKIPGLDFMRGESGRLSISGGADAGWDIKLFQSDPVVKHVPDDTLPQQAEHYDLRVAIRKYSTNDKAIDELVEGYREYAKFDENGLRSAIKHFKAAISHDAEFVIAYAALADAYRQLVQRMWDTDPTHDRLAEEYIEKGSGLDKADSSVAFLRSAAVVEMRKGEHLFRSIADTVEVTVANRDTVNTEMKIPAMMPDVMIYFDSAYRLFEAALSLSSSCPVTRNNFALSKNSLAKMWLEKEHLEEARRVNSQADSILMEGIRSNDVYPPFYINRAAVILTDYRIEIKRGLPGADIGACLDSAEVALTHAIRISDESGESPSPNLGFAFYNLACVRSLQNTPESRRKSIYLLKMAFDANGANFCGHQRTDPDLVNAQRHEPELYREMLFNCDCSDEPPHMDRVIADIY